MSAEKRGVPEKPERYAVGELVMIKAEWRDPGDERVLWRVIEDNGPRLLIEAQLGMPINPRHVVTREMVESVEMERSEPPSVRPEDH